MCSSVECRVRSLKCGKSVKCKVWSVECKVCSVERIVWNVMCNV